MPASVVGVLLRRFTFRHWRKPVRTVLLLMLLSLGWRCLSIRLANRAAVASFANFAGVSSQQMDATIPAPAGTLPESLLGTLRDAISGKGTDTTAGVELIPIVETVCAPPRGAQEGGIGARATFTILGVDLVALQNFAAEQRLDRHWLDQTPRKEGPETEEGLVAGLCRREAVFCSSKLAAKEGLEVGSSLRVVLNDATLALDVAGIIPGRADQPESPSGSAGDGIYLRCRCFPGRRGAWTGLSACSRKRRGRGRLGRGCWSGAGGLRE
jgi:hypothetical protein